MAKMLNLIVLASVAVVRDGKRVYPEPNKAFDFTAAEVEAIKRAHPAALRAPVNESMSAQDSVTAAVQQNAVETTANTEKAPANDTVKPKDEPAAKKPDADDDI